MSLKRNLDQLDVPQSGGGDSVGVSDIFSPTPTYPDHADDEASSSSPNNLFNTAYLAPASKETVSQKLTQSLLYNDFSSNSSVPFVSDSSGKKTS